MAGLLGMPRPRGRRNEDDLLGLSGDIGMTDSSFQGMGRAPVDELWAGRNSAAINDNLFDSTAELAGNRVSQIRDDLMSQFDKEGSDTDLEIRADIRDGYGLDMYPGQVVGRNRKSPEDIIFMQEFSDEGAQLVPGWRGKKNPTLGDILNHALLYEHYPEAANMPVELKDLEANHYGSYGGNSSDNPLGSMHLNRSLDDFDALDTLIHETQHYIQRMEGWPGGGTSGHESVASLERAHPGSTDTLVDEIINAKTDKAWEEANSAYEHKGYSNISGEILARDASARNNAKKHFGEVVKNPVYEQAEKDEAGSILEYIDMVYPARRPDEGNMYPHEMKTSLIDDVVQAGMLNEAIRQRREMGVDPKYANSQTQREALVNLDNLLMIMNR